MILLKKAIAIKNDSLERFQTFFEKGRIVILHAPCGFGKTTLVNEVLCDRCEKILKISADRILDGIRDPDKWEVLVVDDLQTIHSEEEEQLLCALVRDNPNKRFVLLTRGAIPGWVMPFRLTGLMFELSAEDMFFDRETAENFFDKSAVRLQDGELDGIMRDSWGYPLALTLIAEHMKKGEPYGSSLLGEVTHEIYMYFDEMIYKRFDLPTRRFLLELAPFERLTVELAKMVSGDANAGKILTELQNDSSMMLYDSPDTFHFWPVFREFLMWEQNREYTEEQRRALYSRCGLFYELHQECKERVCSARSMPTMPARRNGTAA